MKRSITVHSQAEGDALVRSLEDPIIRAAMVVGGVLAELPPAARRAVLTFCAGTCDTPQDATPLPSIEAGRLRLHDASTPRASTGE